MSLFSKFTKALKRGSETAEFQADPLQAELATLNKDGRLHARYVLNIEQLASVRLDNGLSGVVKDVSYGGFAVRFAVTPDDSRPLEGELGATLTVLDRTVRCKVVPVRVVKQSATIIAGLSLVHESATTLIFLRDFIEPLRCGRTLAPLSKEIRAEKFKGDDWTCLRGEGPTDLIIRSAQDGGVAEALLTFRSHENYAELTFKNGTLKTGRTLGKSHDPKNVGAQMASTATIDPTLIRQAICILANVPAELRRVVQPLLDEATRALNVSQITGAA